VHGFCALNQEDPEYLIKGQLFIKKTGKISDNKGDDHAEDK